MNLIPCFIHKKFLRKKNHGIIKNSNVMFLDISGFTHITEMLMKKGEEGIEILTDILNGIFSHIIEISDNYDGFIGSFAGDAVTVIFEKNDLINTVKCTDEILKFINNYKSPYSEIILNAKAGISVGDIEWGIVGTDNKAYYFKGDAINRASNAERAANRNNIVIYSEKEKDISHFDNYRRLSEKNFFQIKINRRYTKKCKDKKICDTIKSERDFFPTNQLKSIESGEFRNIVSLFISFSKMEEICLLNLMFDHVITLVNKYGGYFNGIDFGDKGAKFIVFFGMPISYENNVLRAVKFAEQFRDEFGDILKMGITYGRCFTGFIGSSKRQTYTALGDRVNTAARLMSKADKNEILVDENIYKILRKNYEFNKEGKFKLKGKKEAETVFKMEKEKTIKKRKKDISLIGRKEELLIIEKFSRKIIEKKCKGLFCINGFAGQGKSRLIREFIKKAKNIFYIIEINCDNLISKSYEPIIIFIESLMGINGKSGEIRERYFNKYYSQLKKDNKFNNLTEFKRNKSLIGALLGIFWDESLYSKMSTDEIMELTKYAIVDFFKVLLERKTLLIFTDDFQWCDNDTKMLIEFIIKTEQLKKGLIIVSSRTNVEIKQLLLNAKDIIIKELKIEPLNIESTGEVIREIIKSNPSNHLKKFIFSKSAGNPFYTEQFVIYLKEMEYLIEKNNSIKIKKNISCLPMTLSSVLASRIDTLSVELKKTLFVASILGNEFDKNMIINMMKSIYNYPESLTKNFLNTGLSNNLWTTLQDIYYIFTHILLREAAYNMMLKKQIRRFHKIAAESLILLSNNDKKLSPEIAYHFEKSKLFDEAFDYYIKAGNLYNDTYNLNESLRYYKKAIIISTKYFGKNDIRIGMSYFSYGLSKKELGKYEDASKYLNKSIEIYRKNRKKSRTKLAKAYSSLGLVYWNMGDYKKSHKYHGMSLNILRQLYEKKHKDIAAEINDIGVVFWYQGKLNKAYKCYMNALKLRKQLFNRNHSEIGDSYNSLGTLFIQQGKYKKSLKYLLKSLQILKNEFGDNHHKTGIGYNNIGVTYYYLGEYNNAIKEFKKSLKIFRVLYSETHINTVWVINNIGGLLNKTGKYNQAERYIKKALDHFIKIYGEMHPNVAMAYNNLGNLNLNKNKLKESLKFHKKALTIKENTLGKSHFDTGLSLLKIGNVFTKMRKFNYADKYYNKATKVIMKSVGNEHVIYGKILMNRGILFYCKKKYSKSIELLKQAKTICKKFSDKDSMKTIEMYLKKNKEEK